MSVCMFSTLQVRNFKVCVMPNNSVNLQKIIYSTENQSEMKKVETLKMEETFFVCLYLLVFILA